MWVPRNLYSAHELLVCTGHHMHSYSVWLTCCRVENYHWCKKPLDPPDDWNFHGFDFYAACCSHHTPVCWFPIFFFFAVAGQSVKAMKISRYMEYVHVHVHVVYVHEGMHGVCTCTSKQYMMCIHSHVCIVCKLFLWCLVLWWSTRFSVYFHVQREYKLLELSSGKLGTQNRIVFWEIGKYLN